MYVHFKIGLVHQIFVNINIINETSVKISLGVIIRHFI